MQPGNCEHLAAVKEVKVAKRLECVECIKTNDTWVHLRTCQSCGATHCCDNSVNRHATRHAQITGHVVVSSAEPGEGWLYCYVDNAVIGY
jgi:hypothetical protein